MSETKHWRVAISIDGEEVLAIEPEMLAGIPDIDKHRDEIIKAANHLLAFIGTGDEEPFIVDEFEETPVQRAMKEAYAAGQDEAAERLWRERA
jgi:hypothetical protein